MSSSSLVTGALPLGSIGSPQPGHRTTGKVSSASLPMLRSPESRQYELIARLWRFPADVRKAAAVTFLQPVNRKTASWTAAIKIPDHRTEAWSERSHSPSEAQCVQGPPGKVERPTLPA